MSVPSLEKIPMMLSLTGSTSAALAAEGAKRARLVWCLATAIDMSSMTAWNSLRSRFSSSRAWMTTTVSPSRPKAPWTISVVFSAEQHPVEFLPARARQVHDFQPERHHRAGDRHHQGRAVHLDQPDARLDRLVRHRPSEADTTPRPPRSS